VLAISVAGAARAVDLTQGAAAHVQQGDGGIDVADLGHARIRTGIDIFPTTLRAM
jgi:hypothetical protein